MTPGSLLLGNAGQNFEIGHQHAAGDRCLSFRYTPEHFEHVVAGVGAGVGARSKPSGFRVLRLPPLRTLSSLVARASAGLEHAADISWEELSVELAAATLRIERGIPAETRNPPASTVARVTRTLRAIERKLNEVAGLSSLAQEAGFSPYHFLRTFERLAGVTPHQYVRRARLREAAARLVANGEKVLDIAYDCGFGDVSNFNRAFRNEFCVSPLRWRMNA